MKMLLLWFLNWQAMLHFISDEQRHEWERTP